MDNDITFDQSQCAALTAMKPHSAVSVIGMVGSGKTSLLIEKVAQILHDDPSACIAVLSPDRRAATQLRNAITSHVGVAGENLTVKSVSAFAFEIVSTFAQAVGRSEPQLISGPDQDVYLKAIFDSPRPKLDKLLAQAGIDTSVGITQLPAFRAEFRDLITRASELGLSSDELADIGVTYGEPIWEVGAEVMRIYDRALALEASSVPGAPDRADHARIVAQASAHLARWEEAVMGAERASIGGSKPTWEWVFVDDLSDATAAVLKLLRVLQADGASIVTFSNPDAAVQSYRGGVAHFGALVERPVSEGGCSATRYVLDCGYRSGGALGTALQQSAQAIHVGSTALQRQAQLCGPHSEIESQFFANSDEEIRYIGAWLRNAHVNDGVNYSNMAIITRSRSMHSSWRSALVRMGIPVAPLISGLPLHQQSAVSALLELVRIAICDPGDIDARTVARFLGGKLIGIDPLRLLSLRKELHGWELKAASNDAVRSDDELLHSLLDDRAHDPISHVEEFRRARAIVLRVRRAYRRRANAEEVLWEAWESTGVAQKWQEIAISDHPHSDTANADLDAVMQLFRVAQRLTDRNPLAASIESLLDVIESQDLPEDSIARSANGTGEVTIATPSALIGRSFDRVVIAGLNDSSWPNTRTRHPLTKVEDLVSVVVGQMLGSEPMKQTVSDVFDDEFRLFHFSLGRARQKVLFTALSSDEDIPSRLFDILGIEKPSDDTVLMLGEYRPHSADNFVGHMRRVLELPDPILVGGAQTVLAQLNDAGITSADPHSWVDTYAYSGENQTSQISVSPSIVEAALECPLKAFFNGAGARDQQDTVKADIGTLIHELAEEFPLGGADSIRSSFRQRWNELSLPDDVHSQRLKSQAEYKVELLISYLNASRERLDGRPVKVETTARGYLDGIRVSAKIDRLENEGGRNWSVVDFKTGDFLPAVALAQTNPQMLIYQWLVNTGAVEGESDAHSLGAHLIRMSKLTKSFRDDEQLEIGPSGMSLAEKMIRTTAELLAGPDIEARTCDACAKCQYFSVCPAQGGKRVFE
ncbi:PD-(D/E)XK nuclease family protein [Arcanobacterium canis]